MQLKNDIVNKANSIIANNNLQATQTASRNLSLALKNNNFEKAYKQIQQLKINIAKLSYEGKPYKKELTEINKLNKIATNELKKSGLTPSDLKPKYFCKICKDTGNNANCICFKRELSKLLINDLNLGPLPKFKDSDFSIFKNNETKIKTLYDKLEKFCKNISSTKINNITLTGNTGVGKTHLALCMVTACIEEGKYCIYSSAFNLNNKVFLKYHLAPANEKESIFAPLLSCDVLIIDDLGSENTLNNVTTEYLYTIINERTINNKKTIITTNLNLSQLRDSYGERTFSRLNNAESALVLNFPGSDLRLKKL